MNSNKVSFSVPRFNFHFHPTKQFFETYLANEAGLLLKLIIAHNSVRNLLETLSHCQHIARVEWKMNENPPHEVSGVSIFSLMNKCQINQQLNPFSRVQ
ncbi:CLUMA_CG010220, isoform A [Clunio marinus]|uniref:CLUMA_CG010220, isoform A n=1 Tax=Clunio marinus TaxID=568069 RepID=A0A1J1I977_9DIPT|nr:CLUMA_CG010220, isoform A [Clunio marinus]